MKLEIMNIMFGLEKFLLFYNHWLRETCLNFGYVVSSVKGTLLPHLYIVVKK